MAPTSCLAPAVTLALASTASALSLASAPITRRSHLPLMTATTRNIFADEITATNLY